MLFIVVLVLRRRETVVISLSIQASPGAGEHGGLWLCLLILKAFLSHLLHCVPIIFKEMYSPGLQVHSGYVDIYLLIYLLLINSQVDQYCGFLFCFGCFFFSFFLSLFFAKNFFFPFASSYVPTLESVTHGAYVLLEAGWICWGKWSDLLLVADDETAHLVSGTVGTLLPSSL